MPHPRDGSDFHLIRPQPYSGFNYGFITRQI